MTVGPAPGASGSLARRLAPDVVTAGLERAIEVDQTNVSVAVDESVIVKWFVPPVPHPHPGILVLDHLRRVGFTDMPRFFAAEVVDGEVVATVTELVPGASDGWEWFVDELTGWIDGTVPRATVLHSADALGALGGRLLLALATPSKVIPDPITPFEVAALHPRWRTMLDEALALATGDAATTLRARVEQIEEVLHAAPRSGTTPACPIHGDLHVGQVLRAGRRLVVIDFDGNPVLEPAERHAPRPPAVDVASFVQSVDHAGRVAQHRRPGEAERLDPLIAEAVTRVLDGYREALRVGGRSELLDDRLLGPMRVAQELHELVYAARHLPRWADVPTATLRAMFPDSTPTGTH